MEGQEEIKTMQDDLGKSTDNPITETKEGQVVNIDGKPHKWCEQKQTWIPANK